jgi:hypothetical protein
MRHQLATLLRTLARRLDPEAHTIHLTTPVQLDGRVIAHEIARAGARR